MRDYIVETNKGMVKGHKRNSIVEYLGIPYAKPPVGKLRFKRAREIEPWEGILEAKEYGNPCSQLHRGQLKGSEDCLFVNVLCPQEGTKLPVFVWIHGGGYSTGGTNEPIFDGIHFAEDGIVFVSFQYRLNVLGFYDFTTYPECKDFESNCGVSDQILALRWIHENIAAFGGDPDKITIAGESAGAASVVNMLACPSVKGLFQQAIAASALPNCICTHEMARENIDLFLEGMGWTQKDLPKLRTMDPYEMQKGNTYVTEKHQYKNPGMFLPGPIQDDLLPVRPIEAIRDGSATGIKLLIGTNMNEGTMFVHPEKTAFPNNWTMIAEMLEKTGNVDTLPKIVNYYHPSANDKKESRQKDREPFIRFATDYAFLAPSLKVAEYQRKYADVWMYRYEFVSKSGLNTGWLASHAFELPFVFGTKNFDFSQFVFEGESDELFEKLTSEIHGAWVQFTKTGHPNPGNWDNYSGYRSPVRIFDRKPKTEILDRTKLMDIWNDLRFYES